MNRWVKIGVSVGLVLIVTGVVALIWAAAAHKLHPTGDIDYGDIAVGIGTLILAIVTLGSVVLGWMSMRQTREEIDISRQEAEAAQRPVVIPVTDAATIIRIPGFNPMEAIPHTLPLALMVPIRNVGAGPALSITVIVVGRDHAGNYSEAWGKRMHHGYALVAAVGETLPVLVTIDRLGGVPDFELQIAYRYLGGRNWVTSAKYRQAGDDGSLGMYYDPKIDTMPPEVGDPGEFCSHSKSATRSRRSRSPRSIRIWAFSRIGRRPQALRPISRPAHRLSYVPYTSRLRFIPDSEAIWSRRRISEHASTLLQVILTPVN
jgi:hypothetical protein